LGHEWIHEIMVECEERGSDGRGVLMENESQPTSGVSRGKGEREGEQDMKKDICTEI
jgi:hypothetical protein